MASNNNNTVEKDVESYLRLRVEAKGGLCLKLIPDFMRGLPDRLILLPGGVFCFAETKRPKGGKLSPSQLVIHTKLRKIGAQVEVVWTKEEADTLVDSLLHTHE